MIKEIIIGIDLGTTNSCVSIFENNKSRVIENDEGFRTTPSIISYVRNNKVLIGNTAKNQRVSNPKKTFYAIKRLIGRKYSDEMVQKNIKLVSYDIVETKSGDAWVKINGKIISPQEISARILLKMKNIAESYIGGKIKSAVITVPAYFNDSQRQATINAGKIAGLNVKRIINEPTAAALAYGLDKSIKDSIVAVYDLGGGTFDISIIEVSKIDGEHQFEVLSTNGDTFLGGEDFDCRLMNFLIKSFKESTDLDLNNDEIALQRLKEAVEIAKIELSSKEYTEINLPYITADKYGPKHFNMEVSRSKLESLVMDLINKTLDTCKVAINDSGKNVNEIDKIILIGGQTRMPKIQEIVQSFFKKNIKKDINPDEAVAVGAGIQAAVLSGEIKDVLLLDITPLSLGIETMGGIMTKLIEKNTTVPTNKKQVFSTAMDNQPAVTIRIFQGERSQAIYNKLLGQFDLTEIPPAPKGVPQIEVNFDIDSNGVLEVNAKNLATNKKQNIVIKSTGGLSKDMINRMVQEAKKNEEFDKGFKELIILKNSTEGIMYSIEKKIKNKFYSDSDILILNKLIYDLKNYLNSGDKDKIKSGVDILNKKSEEFSDKKINKNNKNKDDNKDNNKDKKSNFKKKSENIVDADYEEINKDKK